MPQHMTMPTSAALAIARGQEVVADVVADTILPAQHLYGNAVLQERMAAAAEQDGEPPTSNGLLDADDVEVMAWLLEGVAGVTPAGAVTDIALGLLEVGPDTDAETLAGCAAAGMSIEATLAARDDSAPAPSPVAASLHLQAGACLSEQEAVGGEEGVCVDSEKIGEFADSIETSINRLVRNVGGAVQTVQDQLLAQNKLIAENKELHELLSEALFQGAADLIGVAIGSMTGSVTAQVTMLIGSASVKSYVGYILNSVVAGPMKASISKSLSNFSSRESGETASFDATLRFFEELNRGHGNGYSEALDSALALGLDAMIVLDALMTALVASEEAYLSTMRAAALDAFFAVAGRTTGEQRSPAEGGAIVTEVYALEVIPHSDLSRGIRAVRLPEAVPESLRAEYAARSTLGNRRLLLTIAHILGDHAKAEFHTGTCEVRGIEARDLCGYREPLLHGLVHMMVPERLAEFEQGVEDSHIPIHQHHSFRGDMPGASWRSSGSAAVLRDIEEEAIRRWFLISLEKLGGTSTPLLQLCPAVVFL